MTPFIPKSLIIAASRRDPVKRQENERHMISWRKACKCKCGATSGRLVVRNTVEGNVMKCVGTWHPWPICDDCGKPWKPEAPANEKGQR